MSVLGEDVGMLMVAVREVRKVRNRGVMYM